MLKKLSVELKNIKVPEPKTLFSDTIKIMIIMIINTANRKTITAATKILKKRA